MTITRYRNTRDSTSFAGELVAVLSEDAGFRDALAKALEPEGFGVLSGRPRIEALARLRDWHASWRSLDELGAVVLDVCDQPAAALEVLDAVRRRACAVPVILLVREREMLPTGRRFGSNTVLEGSIDPREAAAAVMRLVAARRAAEAEIEPPSWSRTPRKKRATG